MSEVRLVIGGKAYTIACADGQEDHVGRLGALVDAKLTEFGPNRAPQESQNLLFAALFLADELTEARKRGGDAGPAVTPQADTAEADAMRETIAQLEGELEAMRKAAAPYLRFAEVV